MMASGPKGVASLSKDHWIGLDHALSWVCFDEAFDLRILLRDVLAVVGMSEDQAKDEYQSAWRELANFASSNNWVVRGYRRGKQSESQAQELSRDDLLNCGFVDFVLTPRGRTVLVSQFDRDKHGVWQTIVDPHGSDFAHIVVRREDLLDLKKHIRVSKRVSATKSRAALKSARRQIEGKGPSEVRRDDVISAMREQFEISRETARSHWKAITEHRPDLRSGGRRKRAES